MLSRADGLCDFAVREAPAAADQYLERRAASAVPQYSANGLTYKLESLVPTNGMVVRIKRVLFVSIRT
jgi:hypothetical protein